MTKISYVGYRFPPVIIQQTVWLYARFTLSFRDVEDLLVESGILVSYETVRRCLQHLQRPAPPNLSQDASSVPSLGYADLA